MDENACWSPEGTKIVFQSDRNGFYQLFTMNPDGSEQMVIPNSHNDYWPSWEKDTTQTGMNDNQKSRFGFLLYQNYPNPFNSNTTIRYQLVQTGKVMLQIFDLMGRLVHSLINKQQQAGDYQISWDGSGSDDLKVSLGIYFCQLTAERYSLKNKLILLK